MSESVWLCKLDNQQCWLDKQQCWLDKQQCTEGIQYSVTFHRDGCEHNTVIVGFPCSLSPHAQILTLRSILFESIDLVRSHMTVSSRFCPAPSSASLCMAISSLASSFASEIETKFAEATAEDAKVATEAAAKKAAEAAEAAAKEAAEAAAVAPRVANNRTLVHGLTSRMALHDQSEIVVMLFRQLYRRWTKFCEAHEVCEVDKRPSPAAVQQFIDENLDWAKVGVMARLNRLMWHHDFPKLSPASGYDEYDSSVKI